MLPVETAKVTRRYRRLIDRARKARSFAYCPYSRYKFGAAGLTSKCRIYSAANVENASYGLSMCAERNAVAKALSEGRDRIEAIAVVAGGKGTPSPCGACRQVILEFGDVTVVMSNLKGSPRIEKISRLLPAAFGKGHIK